LAPPQEVLQALHHHLLQAHHLLLVQALNQLVHVAHGMVSIVVTQLLTVQPMLPSALTVMANGAQIASLLTPRLLQVQSQLQHHLQLLQVVAQVAL